MDYEAYTEIEAMVGHGGIVVFDENTNMAHMAEYAMEFCAIESCGKCTPCRVGARRGVEVIQKIRRNIDFEDNTRLLHELCDTMLAGSLCALGGMAPMPVLSSLKKYPEDFKINYTDSIGAESC